jgi:hypothetical protein
MRLVRTRQPFEPIKPVLGQTSTMGAFLPGADIPLIAHSAAAAALGQRLLLARNGRRNLHTSHRQLLPLVVAITRQSQSVRLNPVAPLKTN